MDEKRKGNDEMNVQVRVREVREEKLDEKRVNFMSD